MSNSFNDSLSRMKALMTYGAINEDAKPISTYTLEYKAKAADGKYYGIVRENSKYFVKVATPGKETIAESYQYIGGITNKENYEYSSYNNALKQFELKLGSINEAYDADRHVVTESLDPFKKEDLVIEGTEKMKDELARQRQIMRNASVIMNEATEIGSTPFKTQPEAEHDNSGDKDYPFTKEGKPEEDRGAIKFGEGAPEKHSTTFGDDSKDVEDYDLDKGKAPKVAGSVASEAPKGGKVARVDESMEECGKPFCEEEDDEVDVPEIEDKPVDTDELVTDEDDVEVKPSEDETDPNEEEDLDDDEFDFGDEDEEFGDEGELGDDDEDLDDDEFDFDDEDEEFGDEDEDELGDEEGVEFEAEPGEDDEVEGELGDEEESDEDDFNDEDEDPEIELDESVVKKFRQLVREAINEIFDEVEPEDETGDEELEEEFDDEETFDDEYVNESKFRKMNNIVESVVNDILNEDELHVFGDHPGYRKKPFTLPQTGEDKFQVNRDWNDESVHSEEPFGKGKGDSTPFDQLVAQITDSVMKQINEDKKKVK